MATYTAINTSGPYWGDAIGNVIASRSSTEIVINNLDGTRTVLRGSFVVTDVSIDGTITSMDRVAENGAVLETLTGLGLDVNDFLGLTNSLARFKLVLGLDDVMNGNEGQDYLGGFAGADRLDGGGGDDVLDGGDGGDSLHGNVGTDLLLGGDGDDTLVGGAGGDILDGGINDGPFGDTASYHDSAAAVAVNLATGQASGGDAAGDTFSGIENLQGSAHADTLTGNTGTNILEGGRGADRLDGGAGIDAAVYAGSAQGVLIDLAAGTGSMGDAEGDRLLNIEDVWGSELADMLIGDGRNNSLKGMGGADSLVGADGNDALKGGGGSDLLMGGSGADTLDGGEGRDGASYAYETVGVAVDLMTGTGGGGAAGDTLYSIENVIGTNFIDQILGNSEANWLVGRAGNDELRGGGGDDELSGGVGADRLYGDAGIDLAGYNSSTAAVIVNLETGIGSGGEAEGDTLSGIENLVGSNFNDALTGDRLDNWIVGLDGNDVLVGGGGDDVLDGSSGSDTVTYAGSRDRVVVDIEQRRAVSGDSGSDTLFSIENVIGSAFADVIAGNIEDNAITGGEGDDRLSGGANGLDRLDGGGGNDTADFSSYSWAVWVDLQFIGTPNEAWTRDGSSVTSGTWREIADLAGIENLTGTYFADDLRGDGNANQLAGGDGDDFLNGRGGDDILNGGVGNDTAVFARGLADYAFSLVGNEIRVTGEGTDTVLGNVENFRFAGVTLTRAQLVAEITPPTFTELPDSATLPRAGGTFDALGGNDTVRYAAGTSGMVRLDGGTGTDTFDFSLYGSAVWVDFQYMGTPNEVWTQDDVDLVGGTWRELADVAGIENVIGTVHSDKVWGDANDNVLFYTGGLDRFDGRGGTDTADFSRFGSAVWVDLEYTNTPNEAWTQDDVDLVGGTWREIADLTNVENLTGSGFADLLRGNAGVNRLEGGAGNDTLTGRGGNDAFVFRAGMGQDAITDFAGNGAGAGDVIQLSLGAAYDTFTEVFLAGSQVGSNVVFDFGGGNTLTLNNATLASLHQSDFLFT